MKPLYGQEEFDSAKSYDRLSCECYICQEIFYARKKDIIEHLTKGIKQIKFCSKTCQSKAQIVKQLVVCLNCGKEFLKQLNQIKNYPNNFCNHSCAATYNNTHKTKGTRRSKLEVWLEGKLTEIYPHLEILYCDKTAIDSEIDIYFPTIKLAIELNGIFHYEPIYGEKKLSQIQNNDNRKFAACAEREISLCIIDTSSLSYFKPSKAQKYLDIIINIIDQNLSEPD